MLFIVLDDAGYNDFGFMGCRDLETPNIDRLAADGVLFSDGHVSASVRMGPYKVIRVEGIGTRMYDVEASFDESEDLQKQLPQKYAEMVQRLEEWEQGLVNPVFWDEGVWIPVNMQIYRDLMNNREVQCKSPAEYRRVFGPIPQQ